MPAHGFVLGEPTELCEVVDEPRHEGVPAHGFMLGEPTEFCEVVDEPRHEGVPAHGFVLGEPVTPDPTDIRCINPYLN